MLAIIYLLVTSFTVFAKPAPLDLRIEVLKTLSLAKTAKTDNPEYKMKDLIEDLDFALGGPLPQVFEGSTNVESTIARLNCDDQGKVIKCEIMIHYTFHDEEFQGESGVMIQADFIKSTKPGPKLILKDNKVKVVLAG